MRAALDCVPCLIRQSLDACKKVIDDPQVRQTVLKSILKKAAELDMSLTPPEVAQQFHHLIKKETGCSDPYASIKENSTKKALEISNAMDTKSFSFEQSVRYAIAGNIIDFGVKTDISEEMIAASFEKAEHVHIDISAINSLYKEIESAETVLLLADNAGESVFDKILIEHFPGNPKVYYAVKGAPIINDVTLTDAHQAGIQNVAEIVSNGTDVPGTALNQCPENFMKLFYDADVVISKGQGNFETLNENRRRIYFLFQVKCSVLADSYGFNLGDWIVTTCVE